jgi:tRNA pseudouridine38-40 synthase
MRVALGIEYDGSRYHGWQKQTGLATVQEKVEQALSSVAAQPIQVTCAGRTDAGVHALAQVVHFDTTALRPERAWVVGGNSHLPDDIRFLWATPVAENFHARYSAKSRRYHYVIYNHSIHSALLNHRVSYYPWKLDEDRMQAAAVHLIGEHDFSAYRGIDCQSKTPYRHIFHLQIYRKEGLLIIDVKANAFLHHMVRNIAGVLMEIGEGKRESIWAQEVLQSRKRTSGGITASAQGLYLTQVEYPAEFGVREHNKVLWENVI